MNFKFKKSGFTLSEVMVALALIGFLATLTLSTIGASIQQRARLAEFRSAFAKMEAALKSIEFDRGSVYACYYNMIPVNDRKEMGLKIDGSPATTIKECDAFLRAFTKTMGATHSCETNPLTEGCIPNNYPATSCSSFDFKKAKRAYVFDNSMIFMTLNNTNSADFPGRMAIDVNGRKGPNKWGHDIFPFSLTPTETVTVNNKVYVKEVKFLRPNLTDDFYKSCFVDGAGKTTKEMMKESAGFKN